ncbi:MAG: glutaredoxin domain-containing protein [Simplicispira sp.]|nr:glutaredoxin domain-containing protein [Simplicispira sp.]
MTLLPRTALALTTALCALAWVSAATAQPVYRIVGPDGKVTFSDRAPTEDATPTKSANTGAPDNGMGVLPYALRQIAARFPVTLYTSPECAPCTGGRNLLIQRGIPFTERTITSNEDIEALGRLGGSSSLPFATIGGQHLNGFSDSEWTQYLDAASYPKQSQLPAHYRRPAATPLVTTKRMEPDSAPATPAPQRPAPRPEPAAADRPGPGNPAGIRF